MSLAVKQLIFIYYAFVLLLVAVGMVPSDTAPLGDVLYAAGVLFLVAFGVLVARRLKRQREEERGLAEEQISPFMIKKDGVKLMLPLLAPTVAVIFGLAFLTSWVLTLMGYTGSEVANEALWLMLIKHALIPTVLEELLFRLLPLIILAPYSRRWCVILSAAFFSLVHCDLFQIPYAFVAGLIFILADIMCESILPSLVFHLVNNAASVVWMKYATGQSAILIYLSVLIGAALVSAVVIFVLRRKYREGLRAAFAEGAPLVQYNHILIFTVAMLFIAVTSLLV